MLHSRVLTASRFLHLQIRIVMGVHLQSTARGAAGSCGEGSCECDRGLLCGTRALQQPACVTLCGQEDEPTWSVCAHG